MDGPPHGSEKRGSAPSIETGVTTKVAVKIRLKRMGKIRDPRYRIVIADSRVKRDGKTIEEIGIYDPMQEPSLIKIDGERAKYWLGVGAQPSNTVHNLLKITGDWQAFKGLKGAEGSLKVKEVNADAAAQAVAEAADRAEKLKAEASAKAAEQKAAEESEQASEEA